MAKEITLDDLAGMVNNGFESIRSEINEGFKKVDERFDKVEKRLDIVEEDIKEIKTNIYTETYKFDIKDLDNRVTKLEKKLA
ncbi:MAG: hypothetical protein ACOYS2_02920 [Patescibacteria group bacterium]